MANEILILAGIVKQSLTNRAMIEIMSFKTPVIPVFLYWEPFFKRLEQLFGNRER